MNKFHTFIFFLALILTMSSNSFSSVMKYWDNDSNCAQSVSCGLLDAFNFNKETEIIHPSMINLGGGFGEGFTCGANSGAMVAIGLILSKKGVDKDKIQELRDKFKIEMKKEFNYLLCRDYLKPFNTEDGEIDWDMEGRHEKCTNIVNKAFENAKQLIDDCH